MISIPAPTAVTGTAAQVATMPPGVCTVILSNTGSTNTIYIGTTNAVTDSGGFQGFPLPVGQTVTLPGFPTSKGSALWAIAAGTGNTLGVIVSTAG